MKLRSIEIINKIDKPLTRLRKKNREDQITNKE